MVELTVPVRRRHGSHRLACVVCAQRTEPDEVLVRLSDGWAHEDCADLVLFEA